MVGLAEAPDAAPSILAQAPTPPVLVAAAGVLLDADGAPLPGAVDGLAWLAGVCPEVIVAVDAPPYAADLLVRSLCPAPLVVVGSVPARSAIHNAIALVDDPDTVVVGSAPLHVRAAVMAELRPVGVTTGGHDACDLRRAGATLVVPDLPTAARHLICSHDRSTLQEVS